MTTHRRRGPPDLLPPGTPAPPFALHDTPYSRVALADLRGRAVVLVFYVADWHPVATDQLAVYQGLLPHLEQLNATVLGISVDSTWSHAAFARANGLRFPLLADTSPPGAVARAYGVYAPETGRSRRALFVVDGAGIVRWSAVFPEVLNPGVDGVLSVLEALHQVSDGPLGSRHVSPNGAVVSGCGQAAPQVSPTVDRRP